MLPLVAVVARVCHVTSVIRARHHRHQRQRQRVRLYVICHLLLLPLVAVVAGAHVT